MACNDAHAYNFCGSCSSEVIAWIHNKNPLWQIAKDLAASPKPKYHKGLKIYVITLVALTVVAWSIVGIRAFHMRDVHPLGYIFPLGRTIHRFHLPQRS